MTNCCTRLLKEKIDEKTFGENHKHKYKYSKQIQQVINYCFMKLYKTLLEGEKSNNKKFLKNSDKKCRIKSVMSDS